jgi:hypothetical protein
VAELVPAGTWVELHDVLLPAGARDPNVPADTQAVPLEWRATGRLVVPATVGEVVEVMTMAGRRVRGRLDRVHPAHLHTFGPPVPELAAVGPELRALLRREEHAG